MLHSALLRTTWEMQKGFILKRKGINKYKLQLEQILFPWLFVVLMRRLSCKRISKKSHQFLREKLWVDSWSNFVCCIFAEKVTTFSLILFPISEYLIFLWYLNVSTQCIDNFFNAYRRLKEETFPFFNVSFVYKWKLQAFFLTVS